MLREILGSLPVALAVLMDLAILCSNPPSKYVPERGECCCGPRWDFGSYCLERPVTFAVCQEACDDFKECGAFDFSTGASEGRCCLYKHGNSGFSMESFLDKTCYVQSIISESQGVAILVFMSASFISICWGVPRGAYVPKAAFISGSLYLYGKFANQSSSLVKGLIVAVCGLMLASTICRMTLFSHGSSLTYIEITSFTLLSCRCLFHPFFWTSEAPDDQTSVELPILVVLFFVYSVFSYEHNESQSKRGVSPAGEGIEALSLLLMICVIISCSVHTTYEADRPFLADFDQILFMTLAGSAAVYHILLRRYLTSEETGCNLKLQSSSFMFERQVRHVCKSLTWRKKVALSFFSASFSFCALFFSLAQGHLSLNSHVFPVSPLVAACIGMGMAASLILVSGLSLVSDFEFVHRKPFQDRRLCLVTALKPFEQAMQFIAWFAPSGAEDLHPLPVSDIACKLYDNTDITDRFRQTVNRQETYWAEATGAPCEVLASSLMFCPTVTVRDCSNLVTLPCSRMSEEKRNGLFCIERGQDPTVHTLLFVSMAIAVVVQIVNALEIGIGNRLERTTSRPRLLALGHKMISSASSIGLVCLLVGASFGPSKILPNTTRDFFDGGGHLIADAAAIVGIWWMMLGFCWGFFIANELASVMRDDQIDYAHASSADGVRTTISTVLVFSSPGLYLILMTLYRDMSLSYVFHITSCCFMWMFCGMLVTMFAVGARYEASPADKDKGILGCMKWRGDFVQRLPRGLVCGLLHKHESH